MFFSLENIFGFPGGNCEKCALEMYWKFSFGIRVFGLYWFGFLISEFEPCSDITIEMHWETHKKPTKSSTTPV